jgi:hypothetical protein
MLAAGYHHPTALSALLKVANIGPSTRPPSPASPPARDGSNSSDKANVKCENAPWIRVSDLTGLAAPVWSSRKPAKE